MSSHADSDHQCFGKDVIHPVESTIQDNSRVTSSCAQGTNRQTDEPYVISKSNALRSTVAAIARKRANDEGDHAISRKRRPSLKDKSLVSDEPRTLACPYFKKDPRRHWDCASFKAKNSKISHVKQHIYRNHTRPHFCAVCGEEFPDPRLCDAHMRAGCPESKSFLAPDGITIQQRNELGHRSISKLGVESQWYAMFDIVCPGSSRPQSPYTTPKTCELFITEDFIISDVGINAMLEQLLQGHAKSQIFEDKIRLREAVSRGLRNIVALHGQNAEQGTSPAISQATATPVTGPSIAGDGSTADKLGSPETNDDSARENLDEIEEQSVLPPTVPPTCTHILDLGSLSMPEYGTDTAIDGIYFRPQQGDFQFSYPTTGVDLATASMGWSDETFEATE